MGTLMLQSGELPTKQRLEYLQRTLAACREATVAQEIEQRGLDPKVRRRLGFGFWFWGGLIDAGFGLLLDLQGGLLPCAC